MEQVLQQAQEVAAQAVKQAQQTVASVSVDGVQQHAVATYQSLTKMQRRNIGLVLGMAVLSTVVRQKKAAFLALLINLAAFRLHAFPLQSEKLYDVVGAVTNFSLAWFSIANAKGPFSKPQIFNTVASSIWSVRLGAFLLTRILVQGKDDRFKDIKKDYDALLFAFAMQAAWCFLGQLPLLVSNANKQDEKEEKATSHWPLLGRVLFLVGFGIELVSDAQKTAFNAQNVDGSKFISEGLWAYSRHPNYLGEILLQFGLTLSCSQYFSRLGNLAWLSPAFTALLLTRVSGIPMLEAASLKKWGSDPKYQQYMRDTPVLVPRLF